MSEETEESRRRQLIKGLPASHMWELELYGNDVM